MWRSNGLSGNDPSTGLRVDYKPNTHQLTFVFVSNDNLAVVATDDNGDYKTTLTGSQTDEFPAGLVFWHAIIKDSSNNELSIDSGRIEIALNPRSATQEDSRTIAEKQLEAVEKAVLARAVGQEVEEYRIGSRSVKTMTMTELMALQKQLQLRVAREKHRTGTVNAYVRFREPSGYTPGVWP